MKPEVFDSTVEGVKIVRIKPFKDERGTFAEYYNSRTFKEVGLPNLFMQDNTSWSRAGVVRGMHFQKEGGQGKLIHCVRGAIFDAWVDMRKDSKTFRQVGAMTLGLDPECIEMVYLPPGLAHGFLALTDGSVINYKCTTPYEKEHDVGIRWNSAGIEWPMPDGYEPTVSEKDSKLPSLDEYLAALD